jgi:ABC-2 type transport system permease protein
MAALRYEWVRLRTVRSTWWLLGLALVLQGTLAFLFAKGQGTDPVDAQAAARIVTGGGGEFFLFPALFMGLVGVFAFGHEYRHGVIRATLVAVPRRSRVLAAKILMVAMFTGVVALLSLALNIGIAYLVLGGRGEQLFTADTTARVGLGYVLFVMLNGVVGLALGGLLRNLPGAIVVLVIFPLLIEGILSALLLIPFLEPIRGLWKFLPFTAGSQMMVVGAENFPEEFGRPLGALAGGLTFAVFAAVLTMLCGVLFARRDA